ncbi:MAG: phosphodiester glycosidase family protein [bacterium]|nr:phosphodiester glycosidase family protein [bacterium]
MKFLIHNRKKIVVIFFLGVIFLSLIGVNVLRYKENKSIVSQNLINIGEISDITEKLKNAEKQFLDLKKEDQNKINQTLAKRIADIEDTYRSTLTIYESIQDLRSQKQNVDDLEKSFALVLNMLATVNYPSASASLKTLSKNIDTMKQKMNETTSFASTAIASNTPPASGYQTQRVKVGGAEFTVGIVAADLNTTKVIVDTASDGTCTNNCPVLSLGDYVSRSGAFAGINGSYFCPASYPSCAGKENSFDTLLMNKNKTYFNSDNNVYSSVPAVIFTGNSARFISRSSDWGRDTGVDAVLANQPLLVLNGESVFGGDDEAKRSSRGIRNFVGATGNMVYIGAVYSATAAEAAQVLKTMGIANALNLDSGGSSAIWSGGYKLGPGRNIPNAILFVHK